MPWSTTHCTYVSHNITLHLISWRQLCNDYKCNFTILNGEVSLLRRILYVLLLALHDCSHTLPYFTLPCPLSSYLPLYHLISPNFSLTPSSHSLSYLLSLFLPSPFFSISLSDPLLRTQDGEWFPCSHVIKGSVSALVWMWRRDRKDVGKYGQFSAV